MSVRRVVAGVLFVAATACGGNVRTPPQQSSSPAPPTIDVVRVASQPLDVTLALPGQLDPYETVAVYPKVTGFVRSIAVDRGSRVRAGAIVAELDAPELVAQ